ncbi:unnamed protein product [Brachionus calyciflorus]|uniref:MULE transposase domain-containing protein n=1 Tax=Brachionus calyciflorus TaxID=104777 RepID=A0A813ZD71_9BILA|nr:unnamed protein product [Brachionus calyciflorus]
MVDMLILSNAEIHSEIESDSEEDLDQSMNDDSSLFKRLNKDESTYYTCISAKCKCSITLKNEKIIRAIGQIKNIVFTEITPIPEIYDEEINPLWNSQKFLPNLPKSPEEINLPEDFKKTVVGEPFLLFDTMDDDRIIAFCTNNGLTRLSKAEQWHLDATFKAQCIWRHLSTIGLKKRYTKNEPFRLWIKKLIGLALVPLDMLENAYEIVKTTIPKNEKTSTDKMINYIDNTWIMGRYPRALWNHSNTIGPRTNNNVEGFHSKFNRSIGSSHPHIFKLIKLFQDYESLFSIKCERIQSGLELVIRKKKFVERDKIIFDLVNQLQSNLMSLEIFILKAAYLIGTEPK